MAVCPGVRLVSGGTVCQGLTFGSVFNDDA
jgi:hypothetical protein